MNEGMVMKREAVDRRGGSGGDIDIHSGPPAEQTNAGIEEKPGSCWVGDRSPRPRDGGTKLPRRGGQSSV
jgi:hypothetical protein